MKELDEELVCKDFLHTTKHGAMQGKMRQKTVKYYNLDVIISVAASIRQHLLTKHYKQYKII